MKNISKTMEQEALTPLPISIESCRELEIPKIVVDVSPELIMEDVVGVVYVQMYVHQAHLN
jgi:hypothetical protein